MGFPAPYRRDVHAAHLNELQRDLLNDLGPHADVRPASRCEWCDAGLIVDRRGRCRNCGAPGSEHPGPGPRRIPRTPPTGNPGTR